MNILYMFFFFFSSRRRHTRSDRDWSSDVCSSDLLNGKSEQGLQMMENALRQGIAGRRPDHARLQLAYAYHLAGQDQKAVQIFRTVQGADGAAALARAWAIRLARAS